MSAHILTYFGYVLLNSYSSQLLFSGETFDFPIAASYSLIESFWLVLKIASSVCYHVDRVDYSSSGVGPPENPGVRLGPQAAFCEEIGHLKFCVGWVGGWFLRDSQLVGRVPVLCEEIGQLNF